MPETLNPSGAPQATSPFMGLFPGYGQQTSTLWKHSSDLYLAYLSKLIGARTPADVLLANADFLAAGVAEFSRFQGELRGPAPRSSPDSAG